MNELYNEMVNYCEREYKQNLILLNSRCCCLQVIPFYFEVKRESTTQLPTLYNYLVHLMLVCVQSHYNLLFYSPDEVKQNCLNETLGVFYIFLNTV